MYSFFKKLFSQSCDQINIMCAFKPIYISLSAFGLMPYSLRFPKSKECAIIIHKSIYINSLWSMSVILILHLGFVLHLQQLYADTEHNTMTEVLSTKMNYILELLTLLLFSTVTYFCAFKNRFTCVKILNSITMCSNKLLDHSRAATLREIDVQVKIVTVCLCLLLVIQLMVNFTRDDTMWKKTLVLLTFIVPQMIQFTMISLYYVLVSMIVATLKSINGSLITIVKTRKFYASKLKKVRVKTVDLLLVRILYVKIMDIKREINKTFQASILVTMIQCFHSLVSETYIIYHGVSKEMSLTTHDICNCSIWISYQLMKIYTISRSGMILKEQIAEFGRNLHNIPTGKEDARLYLEIQHFSTLIMHQDAALTVYDYFPLDASLMFNVITSAVMYVIIFVQLEN